MPIITMTTDRPRLCSRCRSTIATNAPATVDTGPGKGQARPVFYCSPECARPQAEMYPGAEFRPLFVGVPLPVKDPGTFSPKPTSPKPPALFAEATARPTWEEMQTADRRRRGLDRPTLETQQATPPPPPRTYTAPTDEEIDATIKEREKARPALNAAAADIVAELERSGGGIWKATPHDLFVEVVVTAPTGEYFTITHTPDKTGYLIRPPFFTSNHRRPPHLKIETIAPPAYIAKRIRRMLPGLFRYFAARRDPLPGDEPTADPLTVKEEATA